MADASKVERSAAPRKPPNAGKGRKKGVPNRLPAELREALKLALDGFAPRIPELLEKVAEKDPARALELVSRLGDFIIPRQSRVTAQVPGMTLADLVAAAGALGKSDLPAPLEAHASAPGSYSVPLDRTLPDSPPAPAPVPRPAPVLIAESESPAEPRASDQAPALPDLPREGLAEGEHTVADLRAKARRPLLDPDYDPYR